MGFGSIGVKEFSKLIDTPDTYSEQKAKFAKVKETEDGLQFYFGDRFTATKIFDGATASPPTRYLKPLTIFPNHTPSESGGRLQRIFAICVGEYIYVGGGRFYEVVYNKQVWRYKPATGEWARMADLPDNYGFYQQNNVAGYHDGKIYLYANYKAAPYCLQVRYRARECLFTVRAQDFFSHSYLPPFTISLASAGFAPPLMDHPLLP